MGKTHKLLKNIQEIRESKYSLALKKAATEKTVPVPAAEARVSEEHSVPAPVAAVFRSPLRNALILSAVACAVLIFSLGIVFSTLYRVPAAKKAAPSKKSVPSKKAVPAQKTATDKKKTGSVKKPSSRKLRPAAGRR